MVRRLKLLASLCAAAAAVSAVLGAGQASAFVPREPSSFFGVSSPNFFVMGQKGQTARLESYLTHIQATGVGWVRDAVPWPDAETAPGVYKWGSFDAQVTRLAQHNLTLQPIIRQTPAWAEDPAAITASCGRNGEPSATGAGQYGAFVGTYLKRYGRNGAFWNSHPTLPYEPVTRVELWNEPNYSPFFCPGPDPERYAAMVASAAGAAHAVDPQAVVSIGGLVALKGNTYSGSKLTGMELGTFLQRMTAAVPGLSSQVNAVAIHLYNQDPDVDISLIGWLRAKMEAAGLGRASILVTEYGWHTQGGAGSVSETLRAQLEQVFANQAPRLNCGVIGIAPHAWVTAEQDPSNVENWWGIASPTDGAPYPTGQAYADQVALFEGNGQVAPPRRTIPVCNAPLPDSDGDGTPDQSDDFPLDPTRHSGSGEVPSDPPTPAPPVNPPRVTSRFFGAMSAGWFSDVGRRRAQAGSMQAGQIGQSREIVAWKQIEPHGPADLASDASWSEMDAIFVRLGLRGVRVLPTFSQAPSWAKSSPAATEGAFATFLTAFAQRYGRGGTFWQQNRQLDSSGLAVRDYEVWDRGNLSSSWWDGSASAGEYASAYLAARAALHQVDPGARALISLDQGGVNYRTFIHDMVAASPGLANDIDGVFVLAGTSRTDAGVQRVVAWVRSELDAAGDSAAPIYVGFGWYTSGAGAMSESDRASFYDQVATDLARSDCGVGGVLARAWVTPQDDPSNTSAWYGMVDPQSFALGATAHGYRDLARTYLGYGPDQAPRAVVHTCLRSPPDTDGDGVPDAAESYPLDPQHATAEDTAPPAPSLDSKPALWSNSRGAALKYSARDATGYWCSLDGAPVADCSTEGRSYSNLAEGAHTFTVRALDSLGLVGPATAYAWTVDTVHPDTSIDSHPGPVTRTGSASFSFSSTETGGGFNCSFDSAPYRPCSSPTAFAGLQDGSHAFRVAAVDRAGNGDPTPASFGFRVDTTPPATTITQGPSGVSQNPGVLFRFASSEARSTFRCRMDTGAWRPCDRGLFLVANLRDGAHMFRVVAVDQAGNRDPSPVDRRFSVQTTPTILAGPADGATSGPRVRFGFSSPSAASFQCRFDAHPFGPCSERRSDASVDPLGSGPHRFQVRGVTKSGRISPPALRRFRVDADPPVVTFPHRPRVHAKRRSTVVRFRVHDASGVVSTRCRLDGGRWRDCRSPVTLRGVSPGAHRLLVRAMDEWGNGSTPARAHWRQPHR